MDDPLLWGLFALGLVGSIGNLTGFLVTLTTGRRYWPPGERDWRYYLHWTLSNLLNVAFVGLAYLDWNTLGLPRPVSLYAGLALFVPFYLAALAAGFDLGSEETMGLSGDLRTGGWYRLSRNPQYVCYLVATVGFVLLVNSALVTVLATIFASWWLLLPFVEEPWLREQYGEAYERYAARVPRFVGTGTVRALVEADHDAR
ncbi:methyltransferase family protein [Haloarchaeobius amylolyticus]|uniref:methyltransferase family protein n=1 Tax=Haloarchaeobius amylolyticus TaxID=1198296 RepID=UPI002270738B|nr:PEMT/PEM2 methyltransferase family protein [Haloarchaeobius amylolyticus]